MQNSRLVLFIFFTSVWVVIIESGYQLVVHAIHSQEILDAYPGGYDIKVLIAPFVLFCAEIFLWFKMFRWPSHPARIFAGLIGLYIWLMIILVNVLTADLYDRELPSYFLWLYVYAGTGHLLFAIVGREYAE